MTYFIHFFIFERHDRIFLKCKNKNVDVRRRVLEELPSAGRFSEKLLSGEP